MNRVYVASRWYPATALEGVPARRSFGLRGEHRGETTLRQHLIAHPALWGGLLEAAPAEPPR